jgi:hypothetical protein
MKKQRDKVDDELRPEYDLRQLLKTGVRGKFAKRYQAGTNLVLLDPACPNKVLSSSEFNASPLRHEPESTDHRPGIDGCFGEGRFPGGSRQR